MKMGDWVDGGCGYAHDFVPACACLLHIIGEMEKTFCDCAVDLTLICQV